MRYEIVRINLTQDKQHLYRMKQVGGMVLELYLTLIREFECSKWYQNFVECKDVLVRE